MISKPLTPRPFVESLLQIMAVAAAFFITGKLGSMLAIPPSYATVIFPPSGIALAAILLYGNRMAWGILLGAFLHNAMVPLIASDFSTSLNSAPISLAIASGATLQAFVAAYLVRRFAGKPDIFSSKKNILLFLFYGGIVGALVNSTFSVSLLVATGGMPAEVFLINWLSWWSGDALGIIIFAPLVIIWLSEHNPIWQDKKWAITLPIITLFSLTIGAVFYETETSNARIKMELEQRTKELSTLIETSINADLNKLQSLNSLYNLSKTISRAEFHTFVRASFGNFQGVQSIQWAPIILATNRNDYEKSVRSEGFPNFQITELDDNKSLVRAGYRPEYVVVDFVEPYQGNEKAMGFDVYSESERHKIIDRAKDTANIAILPQVLLVQETEKQNGFIAFQPVYRYGLPLNTLTERHTAISGYLVAVFRSADMVAAALKNQNLAGLSYRLIDENSPGTELLIFTSTEKEFKPFMLQEKGFLSNSETLLNRVQFRVGARVWQFEIAPTMEYFIQHQSANVWLIFLGGFILTAITTVVMLDSVLHQYQTDTMNHELELFKIGLDNLSTGVIIANNNRVIIYVNESMVKLFDRIKLHFKPTGLIGKNIDLFHKNPSHQENLLNHFTETITSILPLGDYIFTLKASPIINSLGIRLGSVAEWDDITEQEKHVAELIIANTKLVFENTEKAKRAEELVMANIELAFQNAEKTKRAAELVMANTELAFQNAEKTKRAEELVIANIELAFQNTEKAKRAAEFVITNTELVFEREKARCFDTHKKTLLAKTATGLEFIGRDDRI